MRNKPAVVVRMSRKTRLSPEVFMLKVRNQSIVLINTIMKRVLGEAGRYDIVGVPYQIHGMRKAEKIKKILKKKIALHFGLFCDRTLNFLFQDYISSKICAERQEVQSLSIEVRNGGVARRYADQTKRRKNRKSVKRMENQCKAFFTPQRCYLCFDKLNELTDVSFGDAWGAF